MARKKTGTTIWISPKFKKELASHGKKGETYEDIIKKGLPWWGKKKQ